MTEFITSFVAADGANILFAVGGFVLSWIIGVGFTEDAEMKRWKR